MANHSEADIVTHFHFIIEFIFIELETGIFPVSFLTSVFCMMPSDLYLLSDFKVSWLIKTQGLADQWSQTLRKEETDRQTDRQTDRRTAKQLQVAAGIESVEVCYVKHDQ